MSDKFAEFTPQKEFLVCVDSDGCAMDTMDIKHIRCFGPCMVDEWDLDEWRDEILTYWNNVNLYTMTRGINRFKGLTMALTMVTATYRPIDDLPALIAWVETSPELSNGALQKAIDTDPDTVILKKALSWSKAVNEAINALPQEEKVPFPGAKEALCAAHECADVAIVSSANLEAVLDEWKLYELLPHTDIVLAQDAGSKAYCIAQLLKKGYDPKKVVMCGDAPGDLDAANTNGVLFYPILVRHEGESWEKFVTAALGKLTNGSYEGAYQEELIAAFKENLGG